MIMFEDIPFWQKLFYLSFAAGYAVLLISMYEGAKKMKGMRPKLKEFVSFCKDRYRHERQQREIMLNDIKARFHGKKTDRT